MNHLPILAITMGDAAGVGPEIVARALALEEVHQWCRPLIIGAVDILTRAGQLVGSSLAWRKVSAPAEARFQPGTVDVLDLGNLTWDQVTPGVVCPAAGKAAAEYVLKAGELALAGEVEAVVTRSAWTAVSPSPYTLVTSRTSRTVIRGLRHDRRRRRGRHRDRRHRHRGTGRPGSRCRPSRRWCW